MEHIESSNSYIRVAQESLPRLQCEEGASCLWNICIKEQFLAVALGICNSRLSDVNWQPQRTPLCDCLHVFLAR